MRGLLLQVDGMFVQLNAVLVVCALAGWGLRLDLPQALALGACCCVAMVPLTAAYSAAYHLLMMSGYLAPTP